MGIYTWVTDIHLQIYLQRSDIHLGIPTWGGYTPGGAHLGADIHLEMWAWRAGTNLGIHVEIYTWRAY